MTWKINFHVDCLYFCSYQLPCWFSVIWFYLFIYFNLHLNKILIRQGKPVWPNSFSQSVDVRFDIGTYCIQYFFVRKWKIRIHNLAKLSKQCAINLKAKKTFFDIPFPLPQEICNLGQNLHCSNLRDFIPVHELLASQVSWYCAHIIFANVHDLFLGQSANAWLLRSSHYLKCTYTGKCSTIVLTVPSARGKIKVSQIIFFLKDTPTFSKIRLVCVAENGAGMENTWSFSIRHSCTRICKETESWNKKGSIDSKNKNSQR